MCLVRRTTPYSARKPASGLLRSFDPKLRKERDFPVRVDGFLSHERSDSDGVPQKSVLGQLFLSGFMSKMGRGQLKYSCLCSLMIVYAVANYAYYAVVRLQGQLDVYADWADIVEGHYKSL